MEQLKNMITEIVAEQPEINSVFFVGCGASQADLYPAKYFMDGNSRKVRSYIYTSNEFNMAMPVSVDEAAIVITCSLGACKRFSTYKRCRLYGLF